MNKCVLYLRYSSVLQNEQSIEGQERVCREFCKREGYNVVGKYIDRATSASKDIEKRTNFLRMIKDAEKGMFEYVVVYKLDRFSRSRYDMATFKYKLKKSGVLLISATEPISDNPEGIILESVLEGMAEYYSAELSQKVKRGLYESATKHLYLGGRVPTGYKVVDRHYVIDEQSAEGVRIAFRMYADGCHTTDIVNTLNDKGYRTSGNLPYGLQSFRKMFPNVIYIGTYKRGDYVAENVIPAIVDKDTFDRVQERLKTSGRIGGAHKAHSPYLLSGKLFCGHCGSRMSGVTTGTGKYQQSYYRCNEYANYAGCKLKMIRKDGLENLIIKDSMSILTDENIELIAEAAVKENNEYIESVTHIPAILERIADTDKRLSNLYRVLEIDNTIDEIVTRVAELRAQKTALLKQLSDEKSGVIILDKYHIMFWLESFRNGDVNDIKFCQSLINMFVNSVTVSEDEHDKNQLNILIKYNLTDSKDKSVLARKHKRSGNMCIDSPRILIEPAIHISDSILYRYISVPKNKVKHTDM